MFFHHRFSYTLSYVNSTLIILFCLAGFLLTPSYLWTAERRDHNNLKIAEVSGFSECTAETNIVTYILDNVVVLSKLVINSVLPWCELRSGVKPIEVVEMEVGGRRYVTSQRIDARIYGIHMSLESRYNVNKTH